MLLLTAGTHRRGKDAAASAAIPHSESEKAGCAMLIAHNNHVINRSFGGIRLRSACLADGRYKSTFLNIPRGKARLLPNAAPSSPPHAGSWSHRSLDDAPEPGLVTTGYRACAPHRCTTNPNPRPQIPTPTQSPHPPPASPPPPATPHQTPAHRTAQPTHQESPAAPPRAAGAPSHT